MTLGLAPTRGDLLRSTVHYCEGRVAEDSIYAVLHRGCSNLFPDMNLLMATSSSSHSIARDFRERDGDY